MKISQASAEDIFALNVLINSSYRGDTSRKGWTTEADLIDGNRIDQQTLQLCFDDKDATILKVSNESQVIIGCVYLRKSAEELYLGMLTVSPLLQAGGIGKSLLNAAEAHARLRNCKKIIMTVISARTELINWYERHGYHKTGKTEPFHTDEKVGIPRMPLELLVLEKDLQYDLGIKDHKDTKGE